MSANSKTMIVNMTYMHNPAYIQGETEEPEHGFVPSCPNCDQTLDERMHPKFCHKCGTKLSWKIAMRRIYMRLPGRIAWKKFKTGGEIGPNNGKIVKDETFRDQCRMIMEKLPDKCAITLIFFEIGQHTVLCNDADAEDIFETAKDIIYAAANTETRKYTKIKSFNCFKRELKWYMKQNNKLVT